MRGTGNRLGFALHQLGALGLVVNVIVLWNTLYMEAAVNHLRADGAVIAPEDLARLSPLGHDHINFLGRYLAANGRASLAYVSFQ